jgi:hypothetical protein
MSAVKKDVSICNRTGLDVERRSRSSVQANPLTPRELQAADSLTIFVHLVKKVASIHFFRIAAWWREDRAGRSAF